MTATRVCGNDANHNVTATATIASAQSKAPTCTEKGETTYTATFGVDWAKPQTQTVADIAAKDHAWNVEYNFAEDGKNCTATRVCGNDANHNVTATATITSAQSKAPTCTEKGTTTYTATFSEGWAEKQTKDVVDISAKGHTEVIDAAVAPTCTATGKTEGSHCGRCSTVLVAQTEVAAKGHTEVIDAAVAPTCTATGKTEGSHCSVCGETITAQKTVDALGHKKVTDKAVDPTCTETGLTEGSHCSVCNEVLVAQTEIKAKGHTYTYIVTPPTCTEAGYTTYTCACGDSYKANKVAAKGHSYTLLSDELAKAATCTEDAEYYAKCANCGDVHESETFARENTKLNHSYTNKVSNELVSAATCTEPARYKVQCDRCDVISADKTVSVGDAKGHSYSTAVTAPTCTDKGYTTYTCSACGDSYVADEVAALGHSYNAAVTEPTCTDKGYTTHTCSVCKKTYIDTEIEAKGHSYKAVVTEPTCTAGGHTTHTCSVCGYDYTDTYTSALGHSYGTVTFSWNGNNTQCTASHKCSCGHIESVTAEGESITSAITTTATCIDKQVTTYTAVFTAEWIDKKTQTKPVEGAIAPDNHTQAPTYTDNGDKHTKTYPCCGKSLSEGHTYTNGVCVCKKVNTFTITWVNGNTTTTTTVEYGKLPVAPGVDKTGELKKAPDNAYHYTFAGWGEVVAATADATYTAVYSEAAHDYKSNCKVCSVCNYSGDGTRAHKVGNPTCTDDAVCEVCKTVVVNKLGHLFTYNVEKSYWSVDDNGNHVYHFVASCTRENNCSDTDEIAVIAIKQTEGYKAPTCTVDGSATYIATIPSNAEQSWAKTLLNSESGIVSKVFAIEKLGHDLTETPAQAENCTDAGTLGYWTCGTCGEVFVDAEATIHTTVEARKTNPLGHEWKCKAGEAHLICNRSGCTATTTEYIETAHTWVSEGETPATCTKPGEHAGRKCSVCDKEEGGGTIAPLGHDYGVTSYAWTQGGSATLRSTTFGVKTFGTTTGGTTTGGTTTGGTTTGGTTTDGDTWICAATRTCKRDGCTEAEEGHSQTAYSLVTSTVVIPSTCTVMGSTKYTAQFLVAWANEQIQTKQDVPLADHTPNSGIITKSPFYNKTGVRTYYCTACGAETHTAVEPATRVINISVLGDSITAFENYSNGTAAETANSTLAGGRVWFPMTEREYDSEGNPINKGTGEITEAEHIWIYKAAEQLGANILVNNSWSGSAVHFWQYGAPGMWKDRVVQLHDNTGANNGQEPDIIVVYMGTNDFKYTELVNGTYAKIEDGTYFQSVLGTYDGVNFDQLIRDNGDGTFTYATPANTMEAYAISFHKMQQRYPNSEIYVMTLLPFRAGIHQPTEFNKDIKRMANRFGATVIDIEDTGIKADENNYKYLMEDWLHPNLKGMEVLANAFESAVRNNSALYAKKHVNVTYSGMNGVTAMEGTTRTVVMGKNFDAGLKLNDQSLTMEVTVLYGGVDITDSCVTEVDDPNTKLGGKIVNIHIDDVKADIVVIANAHKHEYTGAVTAPTCTEEGYTTYTCSCGDSYVANEVAALNHSYTLLSDKLAEAATCTEDAEYYAKCANCGDVHASETFARENTKLNHSFTDKVSNELASAATCTEPARYRVQCDRCDAISADKTVSVGKAKGHSYAEAEYAWQYDAANNAWICAAKHVCNNDQSHIETATANITSKVKQAATCIAKGWTTYTATFDAVDWAKTQTKDAEDIAALSHAYGNATYEWSNDNINCTAKRVCANDGSHVEEVKATVTSNIVTDATCTKPGQKTYTATFVVDWATKQTANEVISPKGHTNETIPAVAATCTETGLTAGENCSVCGEVLTAPETIGALGHSMTLTEAKDATCTTAGNNAYYTCSRCGGVFKDQLGEEPTTVKNEVIGAQGHKMTKTEAKAATCTDPGNLEYYTCEKCGKVFKDEAGANETTVEKATIPAAGHDISTAAAKSASCTEIGWTAYEYCNKCSYTTYSEINALGHSMTLTEAKDATCTTAGNNAYYTCGRCGGIYEDQDGKMPTTVVIIPSLGHDYDEGTVTIEPTCAKKGVKTFTCGNDSSHTYTVDIAPLVHILEKVNAKDPTCTEAGYVEHYKCSRDDCDVLFLDAEGTITTKEAALVVDAKGHSAETIPAVPATCTNTGLTAGLKCSACGETITKQEEIPALGHTEKAVPGKDATCTETGLTDGVKCSVCGETITEQEEIPALGHTEEAVPGKDATCTETGLTDGVKCSVCGETITEQEEIPALGHTEKAVPGKDATCTETGLTDGVKCSVCGETITEQEEIPALGHTEETVPGKDATCTETGLTDGVKCSVCGETITRQEEIPALGHTEETVPGKDATCTETGLTDGVKCSVCGETITEQEEIPALGHTEETVPGKDATCTETGLTDGVKCSVCGETITEQEEIPALGHTEEVVPGKDATCTETGLTDGVKCSVCGETITEQEEIPALGHTEEVVPGKDATCSEPGLTDGVKCSVCGETITEQEEIPTIAHTEETVPGKDATCSEPGLTDGVKCSVCGETISGLEEIPALGHTEEAVPGKAATCTETGLTDGVKCLVCGETISGLEEIPALGHTEEAVPGKAATCTEIGLTDGVKCSVCGETITEQEKIPALGHTEETVVENNVDATCTTEGSYAKVTYCMVCGEELSRETVVVPTSGHDFNKVKTESSEDGISFVIYECTACEYRYVLVMSDVNHDNELNGNDIEEIQNYLPSEDCDVFLLGDVDNDGEVNSGDAVVILRYLAEYEVDTFHEDIADFNQNGEIDSGDAVAILRYLAGLQ